MKFARSGGLFGKRSPFGELSAGPRALVAGGTARVQQLRRRADAELARGMGRFVAMLLVGVSVLALVFGVAAGLGFFVRYKGVPELAGVFLAGGFWGLMGASVLSAIGHAAQAFFSAKELWFFDAAPVPPWARFFDRASEAALHAVPGAFVLGLAGLSGLVVGAGMGAMAWVRLVVAAVLVALLPFFFAVWVAHVAAFVLPAGKLRRTTMAVAGIVVAVLLVWLRQARVERFITAEGASAMLASLKNVDTGPPLLPPALAARFVVSGEWASLLFLGVWLLSVVGVALMAHRYLYNRARSLASDESPLGLLRDSRRERVLLSLARLWPQDVRALITKDQLAFVRDPAQWGQVVLLLGISALYVVNAGAMRHGFAAMPFVGQALLPAVHTGLVAFIAAGLSARFAFPQQGLEGPAVWLLLASPLPEPRIVLAKYISAFPIVVVFPALIAVLGGVVLALPAPLFLTSLALCVGASATTAAWGVAAGMRAPLYQANSVSELAMGPHAISTMVSSMMLATLASFIVLACGVAWGFAVRAGEGQTTALMALFVATPSVSLSVWAVRRALRSGAQALSQNRS